MLLPPGPQLREHVTALAPVPLLKVIRVLGNMEGWRAAGGRGGGRLLKRHPEENEGRGEVSREGGGERDKREIEDRNGEKEGRETRPLSGADRMTDRQRLTRGKPVCHVTSATAVGAR